MDWALVWDAVKFWLPVAGATIAAGYKAYHALLSKIDNLEDASAALKAEHQSFREGAARRDERLSVLENDHRNTNDKINQVLIMLARLEERIDLLIKRERE